MFSGSWSAALARIGAADDDDDIETMYIVDVHRSMRRLFVVDNLFIYLFHCFRLPSLSIIGRNKYK